MPAETLVKPPETAVPSPEAPSAETAEFNISSGNTLYLANGLQPIGVESVDIGRPEPMDIQVFARTTTEEWRGQPSTSYVIGKVNSGRKEKFVAVRTSGDEEPEIIKLPGLDTAEGKEDEKLHTTETGGLVFTRDETKHKGWLGIRLHNRRGTYADAKIEVAEASHPDLEWDYEVRRNKEKVKKWKKAGAVVLALAAFRGVTAPGGIQDKVLDPSHDSHEYVLDSLHANPDDVPADGIEADGARFSRQEVLQWSEYEVGERVATTMGDLDGHRYDAVKDRAEAFIATHREEILTDDQIESIKSQIGGTNDVEQFKQAMKQLEDHFGIKFKLDKSADLQRAKYMASSVIDALGPLPSGLVKSGFMQGYGAVNFTPKPSDTLQDSAYGTPVAYYGDNEINLLSSGRVEVGPIKVTLMNLKGILLHELGHGLQDKGIVQIDTLTASDSSLVERAKGVASRVVGHPKFTSDYASKSASEEVSETIREVLQGNVADPDHVGQFESRANSIRLNVLMQLEEKYPGITDYLVTRNPGLLES